MLNRNVVQGPLKLLTSICSLCSLCCLLLLSGCGNFFNPSTTSTGSGSSGSGSTSGSTLNSVYVANSSTSLEDVSAYSLSTAGVLTSLETPEAIGVIPTALAINPAGTLVWVGSELGAIYVYVVGSTGSLTLGNSDAAVASIPVSSMVVDPTGQYLLAESNSGTGTAPVVYVYSINSTNGILTAVGTPLALDTGSAFQLVFAPNGTQVFAALGTGGVDVLNFTPTTGSLSKLNVLLQPRETDDADQGLAVDAESQYLFVAETGINGVRVLSISSTGTLTELSGSPYPTGAGAKAVLVDSTNSYVYVGNSATNTISAFTLASTGALTAVTGSPFTTGTSPYALAEDNTGNFLISVNAEGTPDLQVFTITPSTGAIPGSLVSASTASTGNVSPAEATAVIATP